MLQCVPQADLNMDIRCFSVVTNQMPTSIFKFQNLAVAKHIYIHCYPCTPSSSRNQWITSACFSPSQRLQTLQYKSNGRRNGIRARASDIHSENRRDSVSTKADVTDKNDSDLFDYPLFVDEEDPDWPEEEDDGWGLQLSQFFDKMKIKNEKDDDDVDYLTEDELDWDDDTETHLPVKDITAKDWEDAVFRDLGPLVVLFFDRYHRPFDNMKARKELDKAIRIFWDSDKPSPRAVKLDAAKETDLVSALKVKDSPIILFIKSGKIFLRLTEILAADDLAKIMAYFYYGSNQPECLKNMRLVEEEVPAVS